MTVVVAGHREAGPNLERYVEALGDSLAMSVGWLDESASMIDSAFSKSLLHLQARCTADPRAAQLETWEAVTAALQIGSPLFAVTGAQEGTVQCRINHVMHTLTAIGPRAFADAGNWLTTFWLAVICRDRERLTNLCEIPVDRLRSAEGAYDEYVYHWVAALQAHWLGRSGLVEDLTAAIQGSHPEAASVTPRELLQNVLYPPINLFYRFLRQDGTGFNEALTEALELHRAYWTADEDRTRDPSGTVALAPLAVACLAHDGGIPIEVESDYLPKHLLERGWLGEFEV
ncbi:immunity 49 family protein [Streptomyces griseoaurantiacus]|uniref:immunity 49 family protein n=1 Tax=Streptomyces griseoaurantiacus TaxID=68213 RepID=UPI00345F73D5